MRGNVLGVYILLNFIYRLLQPYFGGLGSKNYNGVIGAFIYIFKCVLYNAVSYVGLYINIYIKIS